LTNEGTLTNEYALINNDTLANNDTLINGRWSTLTNNGTLTNDGTLTNNRTIDNNASITNSGTFDITTDGEMNNTGTFTQTAGRTIVNGIFDGGTLDVQGGSLSGSGTIAADSITIGVSATVKPGNSPGTLIMVGDVDLLGTLQTEIASTSDFDVLEVQGIVTLSDTSAFDFLFDGLFTATDGDSFDFLTALDFNFGSGADFFNLNDLSHFTVTGLDAAFGWSVSFTDNFDPQAQTLSYLSLNIFADDSVGDPDPNAVSAPATLGLFGLALTLMGWGSRRRTKLRAHTA